MRRSTLLALILTLIVIVGVVIAFRSFDGREEQLITLDAPLPNHDEVFFINPWAQIPLPLNTLTRLDRGHVYADPPGGGAWELKANRTTTHLTIIHESDIGGTYRKQEYTLALSNLPMELPHEKIRTMAHGRFDVTKHERKPGPVP